MSTVDVLLFTDLGTLVHSRTAGAYRIASELRSNGYSVQVIDHFTRFYRHPKLLEEVVRKFVGVNTLFVGFSSTFFNMEYLDVTGSKPVKGLSVLTKGITYGVPFSIADIKEVALTLNPKIKFVLGGVKAPWLHGTVIDIFVEGYADGMVVELARWLEGRNPFFQYKPVKKGSQILVNHDPKAEKFDFVNSRIAWHPSDLVKPHEVLPIEISRGCIFRCKFCAFPLNGKKKQDHVKDKEVLYREFMTNYERFGTTQYIFSDDTYNDSLEKLEGLADVYRRLPFKINYAAYLRHDLIHRFPDMIGLLKDSGLKSATFGIETLNLKSAQAIGKGLHPEKSVDLLHRLREEWGSEVVVFSGFIIGLPHDTVPIVEKWAERVLDFKFPVDSFRFTPLGLYPDSKAIYKSEFELNYKEFGYEFSDPANTYNWNNPSTGFTFNIANKLADKILKYSGAISRVRAGAFHTMQLRNVKVPWEDIQALSGRDLSNKYDWHAIRENTFKAYVGEVLSL